MFYFMILKMFYFMIFKKDKSIVVACLLKQIFLNNPKYILVTTLNIFGGSTFCLIFKSLNTQYCNARSPICILIDGWIYD